jgi:hypothetical protein
MWNGDPSGKEILGDFMSEVWIHRISYVWHMKPQEAQGVV